MGNRRDDETTKRFLARGFRRGCHSLDGTVSCFSIALSPMCISRVVKGSPVPKGNAEILACLYVCRTIIRKRAYIFNNFTLY